MDPGVRGCLAGRRHGLSAADLTAFGAALRTSRIPCSTPSVAQGRPMEVMERGPHAAATAGTVPASG